MSEAIRISGSGNLFQLLQFARKVADLFGRRPTSGDHAETEAWLGEVVEALDGIAPDNKAIDVLVRAWNLPFVRTLLVSVVASTLKGELPVYSADELFEYGFDADEFNKLVEELVA